MPAEYLACKKSYMDKGISEKVASARCAAAYYKRHGITVNEAAKKAGEASAPIGEIDEVLVKAILSSQNITASATEPTNTDKLKTEAIASNFPGFEDDNLFEIVATRDGARAFTSDGYVATWNPETLASMAHTWTGGTVSANHIKKKTYGVIVASWYVKPDVHQLIRVDDEMKGWIQRNRKDGLGVSIEADDIKLKDLGIVGAAGTGVTIVFPPHTPFCPPEEGCYIMGSEVSSTKPPEEGVKVDEKSTPTEEVSATKGETMSENVVSTIDPARYEAVKVELEAAKQAVADLQKFKDEVISKEKETTLGVIASFIDAAPYKDAPLCTLKAVASALEAQKTKLAEAPVKNSGAVVASTNETPKPTLPAGVKDEAQAARLKEAVERAAKHGRTIKVE